LLKKFMISVLLVLSAIALLSTSAFPAPQPLSVNLVGKWEGKMTGVKFDPAATPNWQYYNNIVFTIRILDQQGDRFYGEIITGDGGNEKFAGVIAGGKGVISGVGMTVFADMPVLEGGAWRMTGHGQGYSPDGYLEAVKFAIHRTSLTP